MIWLVIAQGVALHINANSEALRSRFVAHEGKATIMVERNEFVRGFAGNNWEGVFTEFSEQIKSHIGEQAHGLIVRRFSTTGLVEQAAFEVTLMDAYQSYFDFTVLTMCGIPEITLEGTNEDWESVREGVVALAEYDLGWWTMHLLPMLDQFIAASKGEVNLAFWRSFYKISDQSGGPYITGHVINLFPYLVVALPPPHFAEWEMKHIQMRHGLSREEAKARIDNMYGKPFRNQYLGWQELEYESSSDEISRRNYRDRRMTRSMEGMTSAVLPSELSTAPFIWKYLGAELPMEFVAGFVGVAQNPDTMALRPEIGWSVRGRLG